MMKSSDKHAVHSGSMHAKTPAFVEAAGFLVAFSIMLLIEGVSRVNSNAQPEGDWNGNHTTFPPIVLLVGAVGEVVFAFFGLVVGFFALAGRMADSAVVMACLACELVLGWFVFTVYVLAVPSFNIDRLQMSMPGLTETESKAIIALGMLGAIAVCAALQGGQFFFTLKLFQLLKGNTAFYKGPRNNVRLAGFGFLVLLKGVAELAVGSLLRRRLGGGQYPMPVAAGPFPVVFSELSITDGVVVTLVGLIAIAIALGNVQKAGLHFAGLALFTLLFQLGLYDMGQLGNAPMDALPGGTSQVFLTTALMIMPAYFAMKLDEDPDVVHEEGLAHSNGAV